MLFSASNTWCKCLPSLPIVDASFYRRCKCKLTFYYTNSEQYTIWPQLRSTTGLIGYILLHQDGKKCSPKVNQNTANVIRENKTELGYDLHFPLQVLTTAAEIMEANVKTPKWNFALDNTDTDERSWKGSQTLIDFFSFLPFRVSVLGDYITSLFHSLSRLHYPICPTRCPTCLSSRLVCFIFRFIRMNYET